MSFRVFEVHAIPPGRTEHRCYGRFMSRAAAEGVRDAVSRVGYRSAHVREVEKGKGDGPDDDRPRAA